MTEHDRYGPELIDRLMGRLAPMHLRVDASGVIQSAGRTLRKLIGDAATLGDAFEILRPAQDASVAQLIAADRLMVRPRQSGADMLRGLAAPMPDGGAVLLLGFGVGLIDTVRRHGLTVQDFVPADRAFEMLFLHEATRLMTAELARTNKRLAEARSAAQIEAFTDPLTGLSNRRGLLSALDRALARCVREVCVGFALIVLDLDLFKDVNDRLGHPAGDQVLLNVAERLGEITRSGDTVARMGGDEFMLILPGLVSADVLRRLGSRIIDAIERPVEIGGEICRVSASIGIAVARGRDAGDAMSIMRRADEALYQAKSSGRGQAVFAAEE